MDHTGVSNRLPYACTAGPASVVLGHGKMAEWALEQSLIDPYGMLGHVAKPFLLMNTATLSNFSFFIWRWRAMTKITK
jgi:hypothetical protein